MNTRMNNYKLVITGPTGVGKSVVMEAVVNGLGMDNIAVYPEFISTGFGKLMLEEYLNKRISALTFQSYVLDFYDKTLIPTKISVFERCPDDSVIVFCKEAMRTKRMTQVEYDALNDKLYRIIKRRGLPTYQDPYAKYTRLNNDDIAITANNIIEIVKDDLKSGIGTRIVILKTSIHENKLRIRKRNREGEEHYDTDYVTAINYYYDQI